MAQSKPELEIIWRERLREARLKYEEASDAFRATWGEHFESRLTANPTLAIERARDIETAALCEYVRVLRIYTDLTVHGKLPPEDDGGTGNQWDLRAAPRLFERWRQVDTALQGWKTRGGLSCIRRATPLSGPLE
jgi:hypothetical protein